MPSDAPELIWADQDNLTWVEANPNEAMKDCEAVYVRSDLCTSDQQVRALDDMVEDATMMLIGHSKDHAPGVDWRCDRQWTVNEVRQRMRRILAAVSVTTNEMVDRALAAARNVSLALQTGHVTSAEGKELFHALAALSSATGTLQAEGTTLRECPDCKGLGRWPFSYGGDTCERCSGTGNLAALTPAPQAEGQGALKISPEYQALFDEVKQRAQPEGQAQRLSEAIRQACDLLAERSYGSPARSPAHNARLVLEAALAHATPTAQEGEPVWKSVERKFYRSEWPLAKLLEARNGGLVTDEGEAWVYRYTHKDGVGGEYDMLVRRELVSHPRRHGEGGRGMTQQDKVRELDDYLRNPSMGVPWDIRIQIADAITAQAEENRRLREKIEALPRSTYSCGTQWVRLEQVLAALSSTGEKG